MLVWFFFHQVIKKTTPVQRTSPFCKKTLFLPVGGSIKSRTELSSNIQTPSKTKHVAPAVILTEEAIRQYLSNYHPKLTIQLKVYLNSKFN